MSLVTAIWRIGLLLLLVKYFAQQILIRPINQTSQMAPVILQFTTIIAAIAGIAGGPYFLVERLSLMLNQTKLREAHPKRNHADTSSR